MTSTKKNNHEKIIESATKSFVHNGYTRSTTRQIAEDAGVTEITLFRHFGSKEKLFECVIDRFYQSIPDLTTLFSEQLSGSIDEDLVTISKILLSILVERREGLIMALNEANHFSNAKEIFIKIPTKLHSYLQAYFQEKIEEETFLPNDPIMLSRIFWGLILSYTITMPIAENAGQTNDESDKFIRSFTNIFLDGIRMK